MIASLCRSTNHGINECIDLKPIDSPSFIVKRDNQRSHLAASFFMGHFGPSALFAYLAGIAVLLALFTLWRMTRRHARPAGEQTNFVSLQATSAIANALDPRADPLPEFYYDDIDPGDR